MPAPAFRRALDHLLLRQADLHAGAPHVAGRVGGFDTSVDARSGHGTCACGAPQPCAHAATLLILGAGLDPAGAPAEVRRAERTAFGLHEPPTPVPAFPETATDLEVPADALSEVQRTLLESVPGVVRRSTANYSIPRSETDRLTGLLEAAGTTLVAYSRRPYVRFRASLRGSQPGMARLLAMETPGLSVRQLLEQQGFRIVRKPKSLVHEYEGPTANLHLLGEAFGHHGTAVLLADGQPPPSFETMTLPAAATPPPRAKAPLMPVLFSRRRFDWWTPRDALAPLQLAIVSRHAQPLDRGFMLGNESLRQAERELVAAGLHALRVEDPAPAFATAEAGTLAAEARVTMLSGAPRGAALQTFHHNGFRIVHAGPLERAWLEGPSANLPGLAVGLAQAGVHLMPGPEGWPPLPAPTRDDGPLQPDDPRIPLAREGTLSMPEGGRVGVDTQPQGAVMPRTLRLALHRAGWLAADGRVQALVEDAGRLVAMLRDGGFDAKWPRPTTQTWRLASVRYNERGRTEGGGTIVHLKGPIPLGRMGGVDPGEEAARIADIVHGMEDALKRHHPDARPLAHGAMPGVWVVNHGAGGFLLEAALKGASVTPSMSFNPIPLGRGVVLVDTACLPPRLAEYQRHEDGPRRPVVSPEIENVVRRIAPEGLDIDEELGHYLVPSTRMSALVDALRELGAKVVQRRLAPRGKRHARWEPKLPEDETGARPKLRKPFRARFEGDVPGLRASTQLDPHQREAVAFILHHEHSCLLADEMGLGKTLSAIAAAQFLPGRVLVVCPASARNVWLQEVNGWTTEKARVLNPGQSVDAWREEDGEEKYVVVAYSGLARYADALRSIPFDLVILDESQYVKSRAAQRTRLVEEKLRHVPRRLILSGTPVMNEPSEIRTQLAFVHPEEWSDASWFNRRFQQPWKHGTPDVRDQVLTRLREYLDGVMLRREKRVALPDLPEKNLHVRRLALPAAARRAYDEQEDSFRDYVRDHEETALAGDMARTAGRLERLKQTALVGKLPLIVDELRALLDKGEKVVVFCHYREPIRSLAKELAAYGVVTLTGSTKADERGTVVKRFQNDERTRVFVGQTHAAGVAVTLTAARHAVFCDLEWNPAVHRQAMDRIHRKTQTREVDVHFYLAEDTVEEDVAEVLEEKAEMMDMLLEGRTGGTFGFRDKQVAQREVALRILSRRRRIMVADEE